MDIVVSSFINVITIVSCRVRDRLFSENHLLISERTLFHSMQKSSNCSLKIVTLLSSANIMGVDDTFNVGGKSFIKIRKSKGPKIIPWGIAYFTLPQFK
jgi:hypothetical protein